MNFREEIIARIRQLLDTLVTTEESPAHNGRIFLTARPGKAGALRHVFLGPLELQPVPNLPKGVAPAAYISLDQGRHDLGINTFASHLVEVLSIRIEILLSKLVGISAGGAEPRALTYQATDLLADITKMITQANLNTALGALPENTVQEVVIEEWEFDQRFRGGDLEVLVLTISCEVADPRQQS